MGSIVHQRVGKHTYLYESVSYRNEKGEPRNKRKPVGKLDPVTGQPIYKLGYLDRMTTEGLQADTGSVPASFAISDIRQSSIRDYGAFYLYQRLAEQLGLVGVLQKALPGCWDEVFNLAAYLISTGDPFSYCEDWLASTEAFPVGLMSSQRISELLADITKDGRDDFYQLCYIAGASHGGTGQMPRDCRV